MLPNFIIIGAMKAGTTSLFQYLRDHPDVFMSSPKELHFFSTRAGMDLDWYEAHFAGAGSAIAIGEASASYTTYPQSEGVPERIAEVIPDARLIYLVRHPIDRMRSHYIHRVGAGKETQPIERALITDPIYLATSRYAARIERYFRCFPREQLLIVRSEDLLTMRESCLRQVFGFLGVAASELPSASEREFYRTSDKRVPRPSTQTLRRHAMARRIAHRMPPTAARWGRRIGTERLSPTLGEIGPELRVRLEDLLREDVGQLRHLVGDGFDGWGMA